MRYLHKRNEFLIQKNILSASKDFNVTEEIKTSALVNETFENDITWGGSMLGRLINSTIRRFKIGYSQVKVEPLVKKLEDELNYLLSASIQGDTLVQYNQLRVRAYIEEIRDICLSNLTDEKKLDELLGQHTGLYDPNDPKKNQRTIGIVQEALDVITDDLKDFKKLFGEERDKLIDKLSDFNDDLRKLTAPQGTRVQPTQQGAVSNFNLNFLNTLDKLKNSGLINASYNFDTKFLTSYQLFTETRLLENEEQGQKVATNVPTDQKPVGLDKEKVNQKYNQLLDAWKKSQQAAGQNTNPGEGTRKRLMKQAEGTQTSLPKTGTVQTDQVSTATKITKKEIDEVINLVKTKDEEDQKNNPEVKKLLNDIDTNIPKEKLSSIKVKYDGKDITLSDAIQKLKAETVEESIYVILETNGGAMSPQGTQSGTGSSGGGTSSTAESVEDIWKIYDFDANRSVTRLTQREVDELNALLTKGTQNMRYEPEKRPDPIVSIARIFGEAHQLYFTEVIPSGRPMGRVSQKTFREYYPLGKEKGGGWKDGEAPQGPFAVKSVFNKWKTGVEKLLMNQEYRKILANVKFVVPGAEDKFNDNFNTKVFEAEGDTPTTPTTTKQSDGQILFEFMNNMLDKNKIDDFDALRSSLMAKYFGIKMKEEDKKTTSTPPITQPAKVDFQPNIAYFTGLQDPKISVKGPKFYAIPIVKFVGTDTKSHDVIFMQVIKKITVTNNDDAILVRFTYDDPIIMKNYHKLKLGNSQYIDWSQVTVATNRLFYGLMQSTKTNLKENSKFTLVYGNVNNGEVKGVSQREYTVKSGNRSLKSGEEIKMTPSKFVFNDASKVNEITLQSGFESKVMQNDKATHDENLDKNVKGINKKLIEALKEEFKNL